MCWDGEHGLLESEVPSSSDREVVDVASIYFCFLFGGGSGVRGLFIGTQDMRKM